MSRSATLSQKIRDWIEATSGWFEVRELDTDLGINNSRCKEDRRKILQRLREQGTIEAHPKINKQFRYVDKKVTALDFKASPSAAVLPFSWPLGVETKVNLYPSNIAVVAGSPNAGKTALLLDFIRRNMGQFPISYICSEMGPEELRSRLEMFPDMEIDDWTFRAIERAANFEDVIVPDCVNVIDYLEMTDELFRVNSHLTAISHRFGTGVAIVALQKKQGAIYGRGQEFSLEKPKLYLSMDRGKLIIVKGKGWANPKVDPNGLTIHFKITGGCQFEATSQWSW